MKQETKQETVETVIIGGGVSGLACARRLFESGKDFVLVTDRLGGRIYAADYGISYGTLYVTTDYRHLMDHVDIISPLPFLHTYCMDRNKCVRLFNPRYLRSSWSMRRLMAKVITYRSATTRLRSRLPFICQKTLMENDPFLKRLVEQSAVDFVRENGLEEVNDLFIKHVAYTTMFATYDRMNALHYLETLLPMIVRSYFVDFSKTPQRLAAGYEERVVLEKVISLVERKDGQGYVVKTGEREFQSRNAVIATPAHNTAEFCDLRSDVEEYPVHVLHIRGKRKNAYKPGNTMVMRPAEEIPSIIGVGGYDIVYSTVPDPRLELFYDEYQVVNAVSWKAANQLSGREWRPLQLKAGLFAIGDNNIAGAENSYVTGLFAANKIIGCIPNIA